MLSLYSLLFVIVVISRFGLDSDCSSSWSLHTCTDCKSIKAVFSQLNVTCVVSNMSLSCLGSLICVPEYCKHVEKLSLTISDY